MAENSSHIYQFDTIEEEIIILKTALDAINEMVNYNIMEFYGNPPKEAKLKTEQHHKLFLILLVDFLSKTSDILSNKQNWIAHLKYVCNNPQLAKNIDCLKKAVTEFDNWISEKIIIKDLVVVNSRKSFDLAMSRKNLILICGNISKHNITNLTHKIKILKNIMHENGLCISEKEILIELDELYDRFRTDGLILQTSILAELLNNIRIGILKYLMPIYNKCVKYTSEDKDKYYYEYPQDIKSDIAQIYFWNLMNDVRHRVYIRNFKTYDVIYNANKKVVEHVSTRSK